MYFLPIALFLVISLSILITILSIHIKKSAIQVVNDMGFGWGLAHSFECFLTNKKVNNPDEQITAWGNKVPTKQMFISLKEYGFKTIRLPVTWMHFMDDSDNVDSEWMSRVKEVVDWIINSKLYCIINVGNDGSENLWLSKGITSKNKYINLWKQISNEFKNYNEYLIFESMEIGLYKKGNNYDYLTLLILNQAFVDTVRNSGGKNSERLLIVAGMYKDPDLTLSPEYKLPIDPFKKLAVSLNYFIPTRFTIEFSNRPWNWTDGNGVLHTTPSLNYWGEENDYKELFIYFQNFKESFVDKGIPVIISQVAVVTEDIKDHESLIEYLYSVFSISASYSGIISCLWDSSNKKEGIWNYYDRENRKFFDEEVGEIFKKISNGKYDKLIDFSYYSNIDTVTTVNENGYMRIKLNNKKVRKVIFSVNLDNISSSMVNFGILCNDKNSLYFTTQVNGDIGTRKGSSYIYTIDMRKIDCYDYIEIQKWWNSKYVTFNYLNIELDKQYKFLDYKAYKDSLK